MKKYKINRLYVYITVIYIIASIKCSSARSVFSVENKDFYGIFNNYQKYIRERDVQVANNNSYTIHSYTSNEPTMVVVTPVPIPIEQTSLWPSESITRKHFEIINMLWRKTKIFIDDNDYTVLHTQTPSWYHNNLTTKLFRITEIKNINTILPTRLQVVTTRTPSNIEFYYLNDENNVKDKEEKCSVRSKCVNIKNNSHSMENPKNSNSSFLVFRIRGPSVDVVNEKKSVPTKRFNNNVYLDKSATNSYSTYLVANRPPPSSFEFSVSRNKLFKDHAEHYFTTDSVLIYFNETRKGLFDKTQEISTKKKYKNYKTYDFYPKTTVYDKIKFFEMYDRMTPAIPSKSKTVESGYYDESNTPKVTQKNTQTDQQRILLINVDQGSHEHNQFKPAKKHIRTDEQFNVFPPETTNTKGRLWKNEIKDQTTQSTAIQSNIKDINNYKVAYGFSNRTVQWSEYPFAAVYIYEPSQVRCDAAGISPHWLIASGACLSRLSNNLNGDGRSAFVAYCGVEWWKPERISYVKYSVVHPWFHPTENPRKYLYNIGLVQVVTSMMSACSGWSPVTLMSHQFTTPQEGSVASAIGWGLDRFDSRYASMNLPRSQLTLYNALLFSDDCPGNFLYSEGKNFNRGVLNKNVYCLALPPYFGEDTDPVHGGLLLVGSHLIALYLQEERRPWGAQSAQYTSIWRLIPWITEVAKETEDMETSFIEI